MNKPQNSSFQKGFLVVGLGKGSLGGVNIDGSGVLVGSMGSKGYMGFGTAISTARVCFGLV